MLVSADNNRAVVIVCSDRATSGERHDETGPLLDERLKSIGFNVVEVVVVSDDKKLIYDTICEWIEGNNVNLVLTAGGTGLSPRDVTPEATLDVIERRVPGMEEAMRADSLLHTPRGMLSRCVVGVSGKCLVVNLPGSPRGALENLRVIEPVLDHALGAIAGDKVDP